MTSRPRAGPPTPRRRVRRLAALGVALVACVVSLLLLELGARVVPRTPRLVQRDDRYGWGLIPRAAGYAWDPDAWRRIEVRINSSGLRERELPYDKPPGVRRILVLGDSFAFGQGVAIESAFVKVAERTLRSEGHAVEVVNAGVPGFGTTNELLFFEAEGHRYRPDVVLLAFFLNDVVDNDQRLSRFRRHDDALDGARPWFEEEDGKLVFRGLRSGREDPRGERRTGSQLRTLVARGVAGAQTLLFNAGLGAFPESSCLPHFVLYRTDELPEVRKAWALSSALLRTLAQRVAEGGGRLVVAIIPAVEQVHDDLFRHVSQCATLVGRRFDWIRPEQTLEALLDAEGIPFLPLVLPLRSQAAATGQRLYFRNDPHLNAEGHRLVGALIARGLRTHAPGLASTSRPGRV